MVSKCVLDWINWKGITSDGVVKRIKEAAGNDIVWNHCFIRRQALACKGIPPDLKKALKDVIRVVNFIKGSALNNRLFYQLCTDMRAGHKHCCFIQKCAGSPKVEFLPDFKNWEMKFMHWLLILSYLADIYFPRSTSWIWICKDSTMRFSEIGNMFLVSKSPWSCGLHDSA